MNASVPEKDWKYLRSVHAELLSTMYERINLKAMEILQSEGFPVERSTVHSFDTFRNPTRSLSNVSMTGAAQLSVSKLSSFSSIIF
jgi:hypothetical protein